ncbi:secretion protein EspI [Mycolicibacterium wolinskyi]|uniref:Secretion protein EspI n=1 Tax=Mycolicibacterium wolinskyi TaxID=59750 RepID=A0A132PMN8_9MYCO|nr:secretion protein EspI [Mycolicibacterium wolinskyi]
MAGQPVAAGPQQLRLIAPVQRRPSSGWRRLVYLLTAGLINPGESPRDRNRRALVARVNKEVRGDYRIAVLSLKGGVGKTTTTVALGATLASIRGDRVIAVDANPDFGTLAQRGPDQTRATVRDLLADTSIRRYSDVRAYTSQGESRLEIMASERDPAVSESFSEEDYRQVISLLQRFYNIILTDCGTGLMHSAMKGVLDEANAIILVTSPAMDGATSAQGTLDWLSHQGYGHLVANAVVVVSSSRPGATSMDIDELMRYFQSRSRAVHFIPFDDHLAEGSEVVLNLMNRKTQDAFIELAATVADAFVRTDRRAGGPVMRVE